MCILYMHDWCISINLFIILLKTETFILVYVNNKLKMQLYIIIHSITIKNKDGLFTVFVYLYNNNI